MTDDLLKAATQALKEETAEGAEDGRFTRARVMASLHQGKVKRRTRLAFILPLAACLAAGTAWGAATGRLPAMFHAIGQAVSYTAKAPEPRAAGAAPGPRASPPAAEPPRAEPALEAPPAAPVEPSEPLVSPKPEPVVSAKPALSSSAAFRDTDGDLYRLAHEAHFASHDYARALAGWDAYLRAAPRGRLATEARYNRAICLLRLGRDTEARQALEPFASGKMGYRQNEAQQLLNELGP
jgi:TolA-binding protein